MPLLVCEDSSTLTKPVKVEGGGNLSWGPPLGDRRLMPSNRPQPGLLPPPNKRTSAREVGKLPEGNLGERAGPGAGSETSPVVKASMLSTL